MKSLQGQFLVAAPQLADVNFYKSVVLMIKHDEEGALGLILNRPTDHRVGEVWKADGDDSVECDQPIYFGGPVDGPLIALHRVKAAAESEVLPGLFFSADKEKLHQVASQSARPFRFFVGYAGWAGGQLESELSVGGWLTAKARKDLIFYQGEDLWERVVRLIGEGILGAVKPKHIPDDPSLN